MWGLGSRARNAATVAAALVSVAATGGAAAGATASCPCTIFPSTAVPAQPAVSDGTSIELGVKFRADSDGYVTALRFYKGAANVGTHIGHLWSAAGRQLAEATFTGESASGWQQVQLGQAVPISANTTYVASYWSSAGWFADTYSAFASNVDNAPLHALASAPNGGNGVYRYGSSGFPSSSYQASNYWVDLVFAPTAPLPGDTTPPTITSVAPADGTTGVDVTTAVTAQFDESVTASTVSPSTFSLRTSGGAAVPGSVAYAPDTRTATLTPQSSLAYATTYTATVKGGSGGVADTSGNPLAQDRVWSFTTGAAPPPPPPVQNTGEPILVVTSTADGFDAYLPEILRTEGLNEFDVIDVGGLTAAKLADHAVVVLGRASVSDAQASLLTDWVDAGGKLIAMRPDATLAGLLGLTPGGGSVTEGYVRIDTSSAPGAGITATTMQFHGTADRYTVAAGTRTVATLYTDASTATSNPAVTLRSVGGSGGVAAAFTYDLARSVVYTHQGNPAWAGQERDHVLDQGTTTIRSDDLFFGGASASDWVDLNKVAIPQADEQQRLLANLVTSTASDRLPVPRLWYFPRGYEAVIVMTGDSHPNGSPGTSFAFDRFLSQSAPGCNVADWACIRATSYVSPDSVWTLAPEDAKAYQDEGFEIALHLDVPGANECNDYTSYAQLEGALDTQLNGSHGFTANFEGLLQAPVTIRTHCIVWSDWDSEVRADLAHGIRLNTDYYYWPPSWAAGRSGMFTGVGIPMRFAARDGSLYDVFQATTQLPDETFSTPDEMDAAVTSLLDGAVGANGYYGAFTTNVHNDHADLGARAAADAIVAAAQARGVPVVSAKQLLTWLDGRDASSFQQVTYSAGRLGFTMVVGSGARGLQAMLPVHGPNGDLQSVTHDGQSVTFTRRTVKGVDYAVVAAAAGAYEAVYAGAPSDTTPPTISNLTAAPAVDGTATITWHTDEAATSRIQYGTSPGSLTNTAGDTANRVTDHTVQLTNLTPTTTYYYRATSTDAAGNTATAPTTDNPPAGFSEPVAQSTRTVVDSDVADFAAGTPGSATFVGASGGGSDGEVQLAPAIGEEFAGPGLPSGWSTTAFATGGSAAVSGGSLTVDGARAGTTATYSAGRTLEFYGVLTATAFQHIGLGTTLQTPPWAIFSTGGGSLPLGLYARTRSASASTDTPIAGVSPTVPHRYRIVWQPTSVTYFVDGTQVASHAIAITDALRPLVSDYGVGGADPSVAWLRLGPYATTGTYTSRVVDAGGVADWRTLACVMTLPSGTQVALETRSGSTPTPDAGWSAWQATAADGTVAGPNARYLQYRATLTAANATVSPTLERVAITYATS
jgi:uncharacterized protein DUF4082/Big-like domain-containing protein/purple acid phosphatase-like protein